MSSPERGRQELASSLAAKNSKIVMGSSPTPTRPRYRRGLMGPIILIALGVMFLLQEFVPEWGFSRTWPVLLMLVGVVKLLDSFQPPRPPEGPRI
jgi:hypothetical protein